MGRKILEKRPLKPKKSTEIARKHFATLNVDRNSGDTVCPNFRKAFDTSVKRTRQRNDGRKV